MALIIVFLLLYMASIPFFFIREERPTRYRRILLYAHLTTALILVADVILFIQFDTTLRGSLAEALLYLVFIATAVALLSCTVRLYT